MSTQAGARQRRLPSSQDFAPPPIDEALVDALRESLLGSSEPVLSACHRLVLRGRHDDRRHPVAAAAVVAFGEAVDACIDRGEVEPEAEARLLSFAELSSLEPAELDEEGALTRLANASARSQVLRGRLPYWSASLPPWGRRPAEAPLWSLEGVRLLTARPAPTRLHRMDWARGGSAFREALRRRFRTQGWDEQGLVRVELHAGELRALDGRRSWTIATKKLRDLVLHRDALVLDSPAARTALLLREPWLLGEMLRLLGAQGSLGR